MSTRRRSGLGSGLDALLPPAPEITGGIREAPIEQIRPNPHQPRTVFEQGALDDLAASIREHGIIQPLVVSAMPDGGYDLIAGERRWRASIQAGLKQVPIIIREAASQQLLELALIENVQRADLNPLEEARAYQTLVDEFRLSDGEIARRLGKNSRETIANTRRLLQLVPEAQEAVLSGAITAGHGRALLMIKDTASQRQALAVVVERELSVRASERLAGLIEAHGDLAVALASMEPRAEPEGRAARPSAPTRHAQAQPVSPDDAAVQRALEGILGTPVSISRLQREVRVTIAFHTDEKLQEFFDWLNSR